MSETDAAPMSRRALLNLIGTAAGGAAMYQAMASLGHAAESPYGGPIKLDGDAEGRVGADPRRRACRPGRGL